MRVLCTGGAGYVGSACLRFMLQQGYDAYAYDNLAAGKRAAVPDAERRLVVGDLADRALLSETLDRLEIDAVMHFAAVASVPDSIADPASYWLHNVLGTKNVLDAMGDRGIRKLIFSSTAATYAFTDEMPLTEDSPQRPETPYGTTKLACETMIADYARAYGVEYAVMRYFNASGADPDGEFGEDRDSESHLIPLTLYVPMGRREKLKIFGTDWPTPDGTCVRDYVHVEDIARAHRLALEKLRPGYGRAFNLGSNQGVSVLDVMHACEKAVGAPIRHELAPARPGDPATLVASPARAEAELGWRREHDSIEAIVESAHRWHARYPNGYADKKER